MNWLFNVTINDISVIRVTAHKCAGGLKKLDLRSGSHAIDISYGFLTCPSDTDTGPTFLRLFQETASFQSLSTTRMGIRRTYSRHKPRSPHRDVTSVFADFGNATQYWTTLANIKLTQLQSINNRRQDVINTRRRYTSKDLGFISIRKCPT